MKIIFIFLLSFVIYSNVYSQTEVEEEGETGETIMQRDQFIYTRRAGGPEKKIPKNALEKAVNQKNRIIAETDNPLINGYSSSWKSVNPTGMFYMLTNNNYIAGRTNSITFHPSDANTFYIAAAQGGVWKTTNGGVNWTVMTDNLGSLASGDVAIDPNNPSIIYYGTGELNYSGDSQYGDGIYKSTDGGINWTKIATAAQVGSYISKIIVNPSNSNIVLCSGYSGVFRSTNAGMNWTLTLSLDATSLNMDLSNNQIIYTASGAASAQSLVYKSTDGGISWSNINNGIPTTAGRIQLAISPDNSNYIYASVATASGSLNGLYRTTNAGTNWTLMNSTTNYLSSQGWYDNAVTAIPGNINGVVVGGLDVYSSTNGGTNLTKRSTWSTSSSGNFSHADIHYLSYKGSVLYCCSDGGVYKSTNSGVNWTDLNISMSTLQYQSADYDPTDNNKLYGGTQDNNKQTSTNFGTQWIQRTTGDGGYTVVDPLSTNYVYGQYVNGSVQRSSNYGVSYTEFRPNSSTGGLFYNPYEMAPMNPDVIVFGRDDLWKTTSAKTATTTSGWTQIASTAITGSSVSAIGISYSNVNKIYFGTANGKIFVTSNNGANWTSQSLNNYVSDLAVDSVNDNTCYAVFGGTSLLVSKTTNSGSSWNNISGNLPGIAVNSIVIKYSAPRTLIVGTDIGVYYSTNDGTNWLSLNKGLPAVEVYDLKYKEGSKILLAATHGRGCFTYNFKVTTLSLAIKFEACNGTDSVTAELRSSVLPYGIVDKKKSIGGMAGEYLFDFNNAVNGTPYYIAVKHRNSIQTWSSGTNVFSANALNYNFTTAASQAYGNNMLNTGGVWSLYTADVNQDGAVDGSDIGIIDNDILSTVYGTGLTDLNCDGIVDGSDMLFADNNATRFVISITP